MANANIPAPATAPVQPMFGKDWWQIALPIRFVSLEAAKDGLSVTVEPVNRRRETELCIVWRGTEEQFQAMPRLGKFFKILPKRAKRIYVPGNVWGMFCNDGNNKYSFAILRCYDMSRSQAKRHASQARRDATYSAFRERLLTSIDFDNEGSLEGRSA